MEKTAAGVGIFCIIAAIVGGGFNVPGGFTFPRLASGKVRGILAAFGCVLILRNDLLLAATIATQDSAPPGTSWDQITRAALGLQQHAASAFKNMRQSWDSVASELNR